MKVRRRVQLPNLQDSVADTVLGVVVKDLAADILGKFVSSHVSLVVSRIS